jgi:hypothetical protein
MENIVIFTKKKRCPAEPTCEDRLPPPVRGWREEDTVKYEFTQSICCPKPVRKYYDHELPVLPTDTGLSVRDSYRESFFGINNKHDGINAKMTIDRNSTVIGNIQLGASSATGGGDSAKDKFEKTKLVTMLSFNATSDQKDETDKHMLIQKNKHQYERSGSRNAIWRMCEYNRKMFADKLWEKMKKNAIEFSIIKEQCKAQKIIKNAYKVYKFKSHIQDRINLKRAQLPCPPPHCPASLEPQSPGPVSPELRSRSPSPSPSPGPASPELRSRSPSQSSSLRSVSSESRSPSPVPPTPITRSPPSPFLENVENEDKDEEIRKLKEENKQLRSENL